MARQADGSPWEDTASAPMAPPDRARQAFYPDASRIYEEIDRFGIGADGRTIGLAQRADFDFYRAAPSAGWTKGRAEPDRTDIGAGPIPVEHNGVDFFAYQPFHLFREPSHDALARATNCVQHAASSGRYGGIQWLESSPTIEDTLYWLNLTVDTDVPLVGHSAQRARATLNADGDRNIVDGVKYILSNTWRDEADRVGAVLIVDEVVSASREVTKIDGRPGGYDLVGGHGGIVADMGAEDALQLTFIPNRRHTHHSELRLPSLPSSTTGVRGSLSTRRESVSVQIKDPQGDLLSTAIPTVSFAKYGHYVRTPIAADTPADLFDQVEILARIDANLASASLAGFIIEGMSPYGATDPSMESALTLATFCGMPVVRVGRGNTGGMTAKGDPITIAGNNLSATKARMLLMATMPKLGALPTAQDPQSPTDSELDATTTAIARYQTIFDTH